MKSETLFLDCEFNSYKGELISMALVSANGHEWYEVIPCEDIIDHWVADHVMPVLGKEPLKDKAELSKSLALFLSQFDQVNIIADWPEDIAYLCNAIVTGPGERIDTPALSFQIIRIDAPSRVPHNALSDAIGIRNEFIEMMISLHG